MTYNVVLADDDLDFVTMYDVADMEVSKEGHLYLYDDEDFILGIFNAGEWLYIVAEEWTDNDN